MHMVYELKAGVSFFSEAPLPRTEKTLELL